MTRYTIENDFIRASFDDVGGEPASLVLRTGGDTEYLWGGDDGHFWRSRSPLLFPVIGRMRGGKYTHAGHEYEMSSHGFVRHAAMEAHTEGRDAISFVIRDNEESRRVYPFGFELIRAFRLEKNTLHSCVTVRNTGHETLPFEVGEHPGFLVPVGGEGRFEDWELSLNCGAQPRHMLLSPRFIMSGKSEPFVIENGTIPLRREFFRDDAVVISDVTGAMIRSRKSSRSVTLTCRDACFFGFWQPANGEPPFVCLEPWGGLPAFEASDEAPLESTDTKPYLQHLPIGGEYSFSMDITLA